MKNLIIFLRLTAFLIFAPLTCCEQEPTKLFVGTIQFPKQLNNNDLCLYYKGQKLTTEWDTLSSSAQFSFLESKYAQELYIVVCNNFTHQTDTKNIIQHLQVTDKSYKCYKLTATRIYNEEKNLIQFTWDIVDYVLCNNILPDNTLIFLFNPELIDGLQLHTWKKQQTMRIVPTICINNQATSKELIRTITIARLKAIDIDTIHTKEHSKSKKLSI